MLELSSLSRHPHLIIRDTQTVFISLHVSAVVHSRRVESFPATSKQSPARGIGREAPGGRGGINGGCSRWDLGKPVVLSCLGRDK